MTMKVRVRDRVGLDIIFRVRDRVGLDIIFRVRDRVGLDKGSNLRSTTLEVNSLTITPPVPFRVNITFCFDPE
jgi:hypothetical protein